MGTTDTTITGTTLRVRGNAFPGYYLGRSRETWSTAGRYRRTRP